MSSWDSADARTALMATYLSRYPYPRAGTKGSKPSSPFQRHDINVPARQIQRTVQTIFTGSQDPWGEKDPFAARGRTIYNAHEEPATVPCITAWSAEEPDEKARHEGGTVTPDLSFSALEELRRIDAEEEWKKNHLDQFLMAARSDVDMGLTWAEGHSFSMEQSNDIWGVPTEPGPSSLPGDSGLDYSPFSWDTKGDNARVQEMFDLYIEGEECARSGLVI